jgi:hypothetical protein
MAAPDTGMSLEKFGEWWGSTGKHPEEKLAIANRAGVLSARFLAQYAPWNSLTGTSRNTLYVAYNQLYPAEDATI